MRHLFPISLLLAACSSAVTPALHRPDGGWHLKCAGSLEQCARRADELCKSRGYVVLGGMSTRKLYGAELGVSQVELREAELDIACGDRRGNLPAIVYPSAPASVSIAAGAPVAPASASPAGASIAPAAAPQISPPPSTPQVSPGNN
jgi:hypothetical protein